MKQEKLLKLYDDYSENIYKFALSFTGQTADAEDILQNVFLKLMEKKLDITAGKEKAYLLKMTANMARNHIKSSSVRLKDELDETKIQLYESMTGDEAELYQVVMGLPEIYRTVIYLYFYEEYSYKEIARLLGISMSAVAMRLNRGKEEIRKAL